MTPFQFYIARLMRNERVLRRLSTRWEEMSDEITGRDVALVGNARALAEGRDGTRIDAADFVVRINAAPIHTPASHGTRTDWLGLAVRLRKSDLARLSPARVLWMSPKRKRLSRQIASSPGFYLHSLADYAALKTELSAPPTTGLMLVSLLLCARLKSLTLYGFDFFASKSLSGRRSSHQVPHDFAAEARWIDAQMAQDNRLRLIMPGNAGR